MKIELTGVKGYSFTGRISSLALTDEQFLLLGIEDFHRADDCEVDVEGEYDVDWDDNIAMAYVKDVIALNFATSKLSATNEKQRSVELSDTQFNRNDLESQIEGYADIQAEWFEDKMGKDVDDAYDRYCDAQEDAANSKE